MAVEKENNLPEEADRDFTVRQHKAVYGIGILIIGMDILILILEIIYHVSAIPLWMYAVMLLIFLLGMLICLEAKNRQLAVGKSGLYYCNMFGRIKRFGIEDIGSVKAVFNPELTYLLCDGEGKKICRLEADMRNADRMILYLRDNGIVIHMRFAKRMEKGAKQALGELIDQEVISGEKLQELSRSVYEQAGIQIEEWEEKNRKLGAELVYGFGEYYGSRIDPDADIQKEESRITAAEQELPEDYVCVLEVYVQKEGALVRNRKGKVLSVIFPVFYRRKAMTEEGEIRFYYNGSWKTDMESVLKYLEKYLPRHKFILEQAELGYELKKEIQDRRK